VEAARQDLSDARRADTVGPSSPSEHDNDLPAGPGALTLPCLADTVERITLDIEDDPARGEVIEQLEVRAAALAVGQREVRMVSVCRGRPIAGKP
jgi:hypothetical protein